MDGGTPLPETPAVTQGKTFGIRVGAYLIDGVVLNVVGSAVIFGAIVFIPDGIGFACTGAHSLQRC